MVTTSLSQTLSYRPIKVTSSDHLLVGNQLQLIGGQYQMTIPAHCLRGGAGRWITSPENHTSKSMHILIIKRCEIIFCEFFYRTFSHLTNTTTWTDPRTLSSVPIDEFNWRGLPPGWERFVDNHGDVYYVKYV